MAMLTSTSNAQTTNAVSPFNSGSFAVNPLPDFDPSVNNVANTSLSTTTITASDLDPTRTGPITNIFFTIEGLTHSHISDLTVRVRHTALNGVERVATLFERVGITDTSGNGPVDNQNIDGIGATSNVSGTYRFQDGGTSFWDAAVAAGDNEVIDVLDVAGGTFLPVYSASGAENGLVSLNNAFIGNGLTLNSVLGDWTFEISDRSNQTTNTPVPLAGIQSFTRTNVAFVTAEGSAIPEPSTASGMLLALIGLAARRRRA